MFERQQIIWGKSGQYLIEKSTIIISYLNNISVEIIRFLLCSGFKHIIIVDNKVVTDSDINKLNFCSEKHVNLLYFDVIKNKILINYTDVKIEHINLNPLNITLNDINTYFPINFAIVSTFNGCKIIKDICKNNKIPLLIVDSFGFYGILKLIIIDHFYINRIESKNIDWKIFNPFTELKEYMDKKDISTLSKDEITKVPFILILYHLYRKLNLSYDEIMENEKIKTIFERELDSYLKYYCFDSIPTNFEEAKKELNKIFSGNRYSSKIYDISKLDDSLKQTDFLLFLYDVYCQFQKFSGSFPIYFEFPDFSCSSQFYNELREIYMSKMNSDKYRFIEFVNDHSSNYADILNNLLIDDFYPYLHSFNVMSTDENETHLFQDDNIICTIYQIFKFLDDNSLPITNYDYFEKVIIENLSCFSSKSNVNILSFIKDIFNKNDIYSVTKIIAGLAVQEVFKVITKQFQPITNTCIIDTTLSEQKLTFNS